MGSRTLQEERNDWEPRQNQTLVTHFELPHLNAHVSILVEGLSGARGEMTLYYDMIRYFKIRNEWFASCDVKSGSAQDVFRKIADIV